MPPDSDFNINADGGILYNSFDYLIISLREEVTLEKLSEIKNVSGQSFKDFVEISANHNNELTHHLVIQFGSRLMNLADMNKEKE